MKTWPASIWIAFAILVAVVFLGHQAAPIAQVAAPGPFNRCIAITPSDTVDLAPFTQNGLLTGAVFVGVVGIVAAVMADNSVVNITTNNGITNVPIAVRRVNATTTTATTMVACYRT